MTDDISRPESSPKPTRRRPDISVSQLAGGAAAAATAAAAGAQLGVAGSIIGAAFLSVLTAVASTVYTHSLSRTRRGVSQAVIAVREQGLRNLAKTRPMTRPMTRPGDLSGDPAGDPATVPMSSASADPTAQFERVGAEDSAEGATGDSAVQPGGTARSAADGTRPPRPRVSRRLVVVAGLSALGVFGTALLLITGIELATGSGLSGGSQTTLGKIFVAGSGNDSDRPAGPSESGTSGGSTPSNGSTSAPASPSDDTGSSTSDSPAPSSAPSSDSADPSGSSPSPSAPVDDQSGQSGNPPDQSAPGGGSGGGLGEAPPSAGNLGGSGDAGAGQPPA